MSQSIQHVHYQALCDLAPKLGDLSDCLDVERFRRFLIASERLSFSYSCALLSDEIIDLFQDISDSIHLMDQYAGLRGGDVVNASENRAVLHHSLRDTKGQFLAFQEAAFAFSRSIRNSNSFSHVVQIGIGGSELGPHAMMRALELFGLDAQFDWHFMSSPDRDLIHSVLAKVDIRKTLFIVASKSGSTYETFENLATVRQAAVSAGMSDPDFLKTQVVSVSVPGSRLDDAGFLARFYLDESIGGRFSLCSPVGVLIMALVFGEDVARAFLSGAHEMDVAAEVSDVRNNIALLMAFNIFWERSVFESSAHAMISYSGALSLVPDHFQQLYSESLGKGGHEFEEDGLNLLTGDVLISGEGPNAQHSFFQLLHEGSELIPSIFIGVKDASHEGLLSAMASQILAFSESNIPCVSLMLGEKSPAALGALASVLENAVMFLGFIWGINAYDQAGVERGKVIHKTVLDGENELGSALLDLFKGR